MVNVEVRCEILAGHAINVCLDPGAKRGNHYEAGCARVSM